jgi:Fe-S-cluster containining protein
MVGRYAVAHDLAALEALYKRVDKQVEGWSCPASTDCCHFGLTGREPQVWPNEWALLERTLKTNPVRPPRRLPIARGGGAAGRDDGRCPLLDPTGRCSVYAARPFGCRTFFCARAEGPRARLGRSELVAMSRELVDLAERGDRRAAPRALTRWWTERGLR